MSASAQSIFDTAPLGAVITYTDGTPRPPARFTNQVSKWSRNNGSGVLVAKLPNTRADGASVFALRAGSAYIDRDAVLVMNTGFDTNSDLHFAVDRAPTPGHILCLNGSDRDRQVLAIARTQGEADTWAERNRFSSITLETVSAPAELEAA